MKKVLDRIPLIYSTVDPIVTDVKNALDFLHGMYKRGCRYSGICTARSALFSTVTITGYERMSNHPLISRYVKGIYNKHPPLPKYVNIWKMNKLLTYYDNMGPNSELTFKQLCRKIAVLFMLLGAWRKQAILAIDIANVFVQTDKVILVPNKTLKRTNPKRLLELFVYHSFSENENLCIVNCLKFYIGERNKRMDGSQGRLMITYGNPHKEASSDTLSRWIKGELSNAAIDVTIFQAHSCRAASTSKARQQRIKISEILKRGCWSRENIFIKFYDKYIIKSNCNDFDYSSVVLSQM